LRHVASGCLLRADRAYLPKWGSDQEEVVCQHEPENNSRSNLWNIDRHTNEFMPSVDVSSRSSFIHNFIDVNVNMYLFSYNIGGLPTINLSTILLRSLMR
jgi:dolichyl-phosphate-mannose--protein O-mannosyl transferase